MPIHSLMYILYYTCMHSNTLSLTMEEELFGVGQCVCGGRERERETSQCQKPGCLQNDWQSLKHYSYTNHLAFQFVE